MDAPQSTPQSQLENEQAPAERHIRQTLDKADIDGCFAKFVEQITTASTLPENARCNRLQEILRSSCPANDSAGHFSLLVLKYLKGEQWSAGHVIASLSDPHVPLPPIYSFEGLEFLKGLEEMTATTPHRIRGINRMYQKLADAARSAPTSNGHSQDSSLRLLIRGLWDSAWTRVEAVDASTGELMREMCKKISDVRLRKHLTPIVEDPKNSVDQIISLVTACTKNPELIPSGLELLGYIPLTPFRFWTTVLSSRLLKSKQRTPGSSVSPRKLECLETWLKLLYSLDDKATNVVGHVSLSDLAFKDLALQFLNPCRAVVPPHALVTALLYSLAGHSSFANVSSERASEFITSYAPGLLKQHATGLPLNEMLARLILQLEEASLPNHGVLELILPLLHRRKGLQLALDLLRLVERRGSALSQTACLEAYMAQVLGEVRNTSTSTEQERQHRALALHACQELQQLIAGLGARVRAQGEELEALQARRQFQHILDRANDAHIVPLAYRKTMADIPLQLRVELIHQFAHQYSIDRTRSHCQSWRSIYYLYKYLRYNKLDIGPLFTKAVVRVCVTRPLSENRFVGARRLTWVCQMVAPVEGEDVARKIEHIFWVWRGDLILHSKKTLIAYGGHGDAHVSTMKRLGLI